MPLTSHEKDQLSKLRVGLDGEPALSVSEFLRIFRNGEVESVSLVGELLSGALEMQDTDEMELAMLAGFNLGFSVSHINLLSSLAQAEWHYSHEDIASAFDEIRVPGCVNSLRYLAQWVPEYLEFDEARALGSKAVWALKKIGDASARAALREISVSQKDIVGRLAQEKLLELS